MARRSDWTPRTKGQMLVTHADGTTDRVKTDYRETQRIIRSGNTRTQRPRERRADGTLGYNFSKWVFRNARYHGTCERCGGHITPLDPIRLRPGHVQHRKCPKQETSA